MRYPIEIFDFLEEQPDSNSLFKWAYENCNIDHYLAIFTILFPKFCVIDNMIFSDGIDEFTYKRFRISAKSSKELQITINHIHIIDMFKFKDNINYEKAIFLAKTIGKSWSLTLAESFPNRVFEVPIHLGDRDNITEITLTFYEINEIWF